MVEVVAKATRRRAAGRECCIVLERLLVCSGCFAVAQLILDLILPLKLRQRFYTNSEKGKSTLYGDRSPGPCQLPAKRVHKLFEGEDIDHHIRPVYTVWYCDWIVLRHC